MSTEAGIGGRAVSSSGTVTEFLLRPWRETDAGSVAKYADNPGIERNLSDGFPSPYGLRDAADFLRSAADNGTQLLRAVEVNGEAVGSVGVFFKPGIYRRTAEIGYWLGEPFWRRGIMSAAVTELSRFLFETTEIVRIYAQPFARNAGSRGTLEKAGFTLEGIFRKGAVKHGELLDTCMYALVKE